MGTQGSLKQPLMVNHTTPDAVIAAAADQVSKRNELLTNQIAPFAFVKGE